MIAIKGSAHKIPKGAYHVGKTKEDTQISTTWVINPKLSHDDKMNFLIELINFCGSNGFMVNEVIDNHLKVSSTAGLFNKVFQTQIADFISETKAYHANMNELIIPASWVGKLGGIVGLNSDGSF